MTIPSIAGVSKSHSILNLQFFSFCFLTGRVWSWQFTTPLSKLYSLHGQPGEGLNFWGRPLKYSCFSSGYKHHCSLQPLEYLSLRMLTGYNTSSTLFAIGAGPHIFPPRTIGNKDECMCVKPLQSCLILCNPMDFSRPDSSVPGDSPSKNIEVVLLPFPPGN